MQRNSYIVAIAVTRDLDLLNENDRQTASGISTVPKLPISVAARPPPPHPAADISGGRPLYAPGDRQTDRKRVKEDRLDSSDR